MLDIIMNYDKIGFKSVIRSGVSSVAFTIFQSFWRRKDKILGIFPQPLEKLAKELIVSACKQYEQNYIDEHGTLKVLGIREPVKLESVYTEVLFSNTDTNDNAIRSFAAIKNLDKLYPQEKSQKSKFQDSQQKLGIKLAYEKQYLMVLGEAGAGKSTFLRKVGIEALKGRKGGFKSGYIPVFVNLQKLSFSENEYIEKIMIEEFRTCKFPVPERFTSEALHQGRLLILLDGLDQVPSNKLSETINQIQSFVDRNNKNRFIVSCRPAYYHNFRQFSEVTIADFDDEKIQKFINNWFQGKNDHQTKMGDKCWELLQKSENKVAKELSHRPLFLTFLCLVYDRFQNFPNNRSVLCKKVLLILLEEWVLENRVLGDEIYQGLHTNLQNLLLSEIAYTGFKSNRLFFSQREIVEQINKFLASNLDTQYYLDGKAVLDAIIQKGILVKSVEDVFSFSNLTLQEYLTAQYINDYHLAEKLVTEHLIDKTWKDVFILVAEVTRGSADDLLVLMEKEVRKYINTQKLQALLNWSKQVTDVSTGNYKPIEKHLIAIANAKNYAIDYTMVKAHIQIYTNAITYANDYINTYEGKYADDYLKVYKKAHEKAYADTWKSFGNSIYDLSNTYANTIKYICVLKNLHIFDQNLNLTRLSIEIERLKAKIPNKKQSKEIHLAFALDFMKTLLNGFHLTPEMVDISVAEIEALDNYLYVNNLIIECLKIADKLTPNLNSNLIAKGR